MPHRRRAFRLLLAVALCALPPSPLAGQHLRGRVVSEEDGAALAGTQVVLEDTAGGSVAVALSNAAGAFRFELPGPGRYVLRGYHPGREAGPLPVTLEGGDTADVELSLPALVIPLDDLSTERGGRSCRVPEATTERVVALWNEVHKALSVATLVEDRGLHGFEVETWYRELDPRRLRVLDEDRSSRPGFRPTVRVPSPPAAELAREGFVRGGGPGESLAFYGPDARTLMSVTFPSTHCLGFTDQGPEEGWVGLTFSPLDERAMDVEGALWIDAETYEPRLLEYRYSKLPWPVKTDKLGGGAEFRRLSDGALIVSRWWMRMPRVGVGQSRITQWAEPTRRYTLAAIFEEGGEVLRVRMPGGGIEELRRE
jgi:hypothetical protein